MVNLPPDPRDDPAELHRLGMAIIATLDDDAFVDEQTRRAAHGDETAQMYLDIRNRLLAARRRAALSGGACGASLTCRWDEE